jgi:hypothetical protein
MKNKETLEEVAERLYPGIDRQVDRMLFIKGAKWQKEQLCNSEIIQRIRATKSDAEARRLIRTI